MGNPDPLEDDKNVLKQVAAAAEVYYNYKNQSQCLNITDGDDIGASMWEYQVLFQKGLKIQRHPMVYFLYLT